MESVNILTFKWGTLYSAEYVNRIYRGVKAHLKRPFRFVCVTDDKTGLAEGIDAVDFPPRPPEMKNLYTYEKNLGSYDYPVKDPLEGHFLLLEATYRLKKTRGLDGEFYDDQPFGSLSAFVKQFHDWYAELSENKRGFAPLNPVLKGERLTSVVKTLSLGAKNESYVIKPGVCEGELIGGNLSLVTKLVSGKYSVNFENKILYGEPNKYRDVWLKETKNTLVYFAKRKAEYYSSIRLRNKNDSVPQILKYLYLFHL